MNRMDEIRQLYAQVRAVDPWESFGDVAYLLRQLDSALKTISLLNMRCDSAQKEAARLQKVVEQRELELDALSSEGE